MHRQTLPIEQLSVWMTLNDVKAQGVQFQNGQNGSCIVANEQLTSTGLSVLQIPPELVLSLENVWIYAKADRHLAQVLEAVGDFARVS